MSRIHWQRRRRRLVRVFVFHLREILMGSRWGPLIGRGKAFDPNRFFIFCANVMGSPYGSASPVTINPDSGKPYGPEFPRTSIRDDVRCVIFHSSPMVPDLIY